MKKRFLHMAQQLSTQSSTKGPTSSNAQAAMHRIERRHSRWYELLLFSSIVQMPLGIVVVALMPAMLLWGPAPWARGGATAVNTMGGVAAGFAVSLFLLKRLTRYSAHPQLGVVGFTVSGSFLVVFAVFLFTRLSYARSILVAGYCLTLAWFVVDYFLGLSFHHRKIAVIPAVGCDHLASTKTTHIHHLRSPHTAGARYDAIVTNFDDDELSPQWQRFLTDCIFAQVPIYDVQRIREEITGRVQIDRLSENDAGALLPSPIYSIIKRFMDIAAVLLLAPLIVPVVLITAVAVRLDSPGPAFFVQSRVGQRNRDFRMYKLRSMRTDAERNGARMAQVRDNRITRIGGFLRRTRLDELPQFLNILKGDMSLIGPRPEQRPFVDKYNEQIPFYMYRHVVKPGITGWAQTVQGYAGNEDETRVKIQHDFYYIKNFSLWLDLLIAIKTLRVLITGSGSR